jgi:predicted ATPase
VLVQGVPPQSEYRFKHALIQDAAYENLLKSRRQVLHRRLGEVLRDKFTAIAATQPELVAHHFSQAGLTEAAIEWWGKAGQQSLERSAFVEATAQLTRALDEIAALQSTPTLRREELKFQVALINAVMHVKGYAAPETRAAVERARVLIERSEALREPLEDPLIMYSALYAETTVSIVAFDGDLARPQAAHFLTLAEKEGTTAPLLMAHRFMGLSLVYTGDSVGALPHLEQAIALYNPSEHRSLAVRFGQDAGVHALTYRAWALWLTGRPQSALVACKRALGAARENGHAATLMNTLALTAFTSLFCGNYETANLQAKEVLGLAEERGLMYWTAYAKWIPGWTALLCGKAADAFDMLTSGISAWRSTGATLFAPTHLSCLAVAYAMLGQVDEAQRSIDEAMTAVEKSKETWFEAEVYRLAGEIALKLPEPDAAKAQAYFHRALAVARQQHAKSWELRAAISLARLWRDQGNVQQARQLLAPVYGWFTEGFDTRDLKEAKALINSLSL